MTQPTTIAPVDGRRTRSVSRAIGESARRGDVVELRIVAVLAALAVTWIVALEWLFAAAWSSAAGLALAMAPAMLLVLFVATPAFANKTPVRWVACRGFLLGVLVVLVPWHERKRFVHDVYTVRLGMSVDDVDAILGGYTQGAGAAWQLPAQDPRVRAPGEPEDAAWVEAARAAFAADRAPDYPQGVERDYFTGTRIYRWSERPAYNADWGAIAFVAGKVVEVRFLPD